jgi:hypothetical protein
MGSTGKMRLPNLTSLAVANSPNSDHPWSLARLRLANGRSLKSSTVVVSLRISPARHFSQTHPVSFRSLDRAKNGHFENNRERFPNGLGTAWKINIVPTAFEGDGYLLITAPGRWITQRGGLALTLDGRRNEQKTVYFPDRSADVPSIDLGFGVVDISVPEQPRLR